MLWVFVVVPAITSCKALLENTGFCDTSVLGSAISNYRPKGSYIKDLGLISKI